MAGFKQSPTQLLLLRGAKQLLTLRGPNAPRRGPEFGELGIIEDGSILIRDGVIAQVGTTRRIENLKEVRGAPEIDVTGAIVLPGFIDPAIRLGTGLSQTTTKSKASSLYEEGLHLMRSCLDYGTLNAQVRIGNDDGDTRSDTAALRQLARIGNHPIGMLRAWLPPATSFAGGANVCDYLGTALFLKKNKLAHAVELSAEWSESCRAEVCQAAAESGLGMNVYWPGGPAAVLSDYLHKARPQSVFCPNDLSAAECSACKQSPVPLIFSTVGSIAREHVSDTLRVLANAGAPLALGSGYDLRELPVFNMQLAISLAVLRHGLTPEQAIAAATINAAHAVGRGASLGSLETGKLADLLVINLPDYRQIPRQLGTNTVGMAIREGKISFNRAGWKVSRT